MPKRILTLLARSGKAAFNGSIILEKHVLLSWPEPLADIVDLHCISVQKELQVAIIIALNSLSSTTFVSVKFSGESKEYIHDRDRVGAHQCVLSWDYQLSSVGNVHRGAHLTFKYVNEILVAIQ